MTRQNENSSRAAAELQEITTSSDRRTKPDLVAEGIHKIAGNVEKLTKLVGAGR